MKPRDKRDHTRSHEREVLNKEQGKKRSARESSGMHHSSTRCLGVSQIENYDKYYNYDRPSPCRGCGGIFCSRGLPMLKTSKLQ